MLVPPSSGDATPIKPNPLHGLKATGKPSTPQQKKLMGACQDFEAVMLSMVFKKMGESAASKDDPLNKGAGSDTWRDMLADERAKQMSKTGSIGLADTIYRQLANRV